MRGVFDAALIHNERPSTFLQSVFTATGQIRCSRLMLAAAMVTSYIGSRTKGKLFQGEVRVTNTECQFVSSPTCNMLDRL
jgi:hypothetical protein